MPTPEDIRKWAGSQGVPTHDEMVKSFRILQESMNSMALDSVRAEGERIRRKAQVEQATIDARDLAVQQAEEVRLLREEVRQLREGSDVGARKTLVAAWWAVGIAVLTLLATVLFWLLAH